jgi:iron complex outermembrane recepter protein
MRAENNKFTPAFCLVHTHKALNFNQQGNTHMRKHLLNTLKTTTIVAGSIMLAQMAHGQNAPATLPASAPAADSGDIVVTGTRIVSPNLTSAAPVTIVSAQDLKISGTTRIEDMLNSLPQVFAAQASTLSNGANGTATVNLRGLGEARTLVLINGRRLQPGDPGSASVSDLNMIPSSLVKRVDVLTGGASTTYGADAVAGVVNFVLDTNFNGLKVDGLYSLFQHNNRSSVTPSILDARIASGLSGYAYPKGSVSDGDTIDTTVTLGGSFGDSKGHIVAYAGYRQTSAVLQSNRDYSACTIQNSSKTALKCGGSATAYGNLLDGTSNPYHFTSTGGIAPGFTRYNFAPTNYFQRPDTRYTAGMFAHYDINPALKPYMEFMFMDDHSVAQIAPSGDFGNTNTLNCDNPLLSAAQKAVICTSANLVNGFDIAGGPLNGYTNPGAAPIVFTDPYTGKTYNKGAATVLNRNYQGGPRQDDLEHTDYRIVLGSKGTLGKAWSYDAYYQLGKTIYNESYKNDVSINNLRNALDIVAGPNGTPICRQAEQGGSAPNCSPLDIFTGAGPSTAAINYVTAQGFKRGSITESILSGSLTGDLGQYGLKSPSAKQGVSVNLSLETRKDTLDLQTDREFSTGDLAGQGGATLPSNGSIRVVEEIGEVNFPIVQDEGIHLLSLNGALRHSDYTKGAGGTFSTNTYKIEGKFAPIRDIELRASYNRAARAPNIQELYSTNHVANDGSTDPCAGSAPAYTQQQCLLSGVTAAQYGKIVANPASQYNGFVGGNPGLTPEIADTFTVGVLLQPHMIKNFSLSLDYFNIKVKNLIQSIGADVILKQCVTSGQFCNFITRAPSSGSLWLSPSGYVTDTTQNLGGESTSGLDVNANWSHRFKRIGNVSVAMIGTALNSLVLNNGVSTPYDCTGYYGVNCGTPNPAWRHKMRVSLETKHNVDVSLQWRYFGSVNVDWSSSNATLHNANYGNFGSSLGAQSYFDLSAALHLFKKSTFRIGVNNLLDKDPPLVTSGSAVQSACAGTYCNGNTYPGVYDALGRYVYSNFTLQF